MGIAMCFSWEIFLKVFSWFWAIWRALRNLDDHVLRGEREQLTQGNQVENIAWQNMDLPTFRYSTDCAWAVFGII